MGQFGATAVEHVAQTQQGQQLLKERARKRMYKKLVKQRENALRNIDALIAKAQADGDEEKVKNLQAEKAQLQKHMEEDNWEKRKFEGAQKDDNHAIERLQAQ